MKHSTYILITFFALCFALNSFAQECGTQPTRTAIEYLTRTVRERQAYEIPASRSGVLLYKVPVKAHIVRRSNGTDGLSLQDLHDAIRRTNKLYVNAGIEFYLYGKPNYINSDKYYDFQTSEEDGLTSNRKIKDVINIFFVNTLKNANGASLCGYAYFPDPPLVSNRPIMMKNSCTAGMTLAHELGHYFSLYHTHGKTNNGTTDELVNGSNCGSRGDDVCDTPADPNLSGQVFGCQYTGTMTDRNGDFYTPDVRNIMSYSGSCRTRFSPKQYARIRYSLEHDRETLICGPNENSNLSATVSNSKIIRKRGKITSTQTITAQGTRIYSASQTITLKPGFHAKQGSYLIANLSKGRDCGAPGFRQGREEESQESSFSSLPVPFKGYPNPFKTNVTLEYELVHPGTVSLLIRSSMGQLIAQPLNKQFTQTGSHKYEWNAQNLPTGIYIAELIIGSERQIVKLIKH